MNNDKQEETQAAQGATMSGMASTQVGSVATGTVKTVRVALLGVCLALGVHGASSVAAQESTVPPVDNAAQTVTEEVEDTGFDDWGLLGLLGLGGLAGLLKRPTHEVRTVERVNDPRR